MKSLQRLQRSWPVFASVAIVLALAGAPAAWGQTMTTGDIVGIVTDASGAVVPNAKITAKLTTTNETHSVTSNSSGQYRFSLLQSGEYEVTGEATALKSKTQKFLLMAGQAPAINLVLEVQGATQVVEVAAQATILQTENADLASGLTGDQVANLPANGADLTTLAFTVPGILMMPTGAGGGGASGNNSVNGIPGATTLYTLNGADDMDPYLNINNSGASNNLLGQNEVAEASVVLNAYSADYGRMTGAQVNLIGKSGGNSFHGNLFHNFNDKIFNANDFFNNQASLQAPRSDAHNFGGSVGGPIKKDKLFFFFNYESLQYALPGSGVVRIPSPQMQTYTLAHIPAASVPMYQDAFNLWNGAPGVSSAIPVTNGNGPLQDGNNNLGCGTYTFMSTAVPAPGGGTFGSQGKPATAQNVPCTVAWAANASQLNKESLIVGRGDYNINDRQKISGRYEYDWGIQATGVSYISPTFNQQSVQPSHQGQLTYTYVINPALVNNFVGSGMYYSAIFGYPDINKAVTAMPEEIAVNDTGWATLGTATNMPQGRNVGQAQLVDDLTWIKGKHTFKFGINYRYNKITDYTNSEGAYAGEYIFADLMDFATGQVNASGNGSSFRQTYPNLLRVHLRMSSLGAYAQDVWKVRRDLSVTLGFRIEHDGDPSCLDNCFSSMNTQFGTSGYVGGASVPYNQTITTGLHNLYQHLESIIPEPRFGFAWNLNSKTVVRGGIGLFANLFSGSVASSVFRNPPNVYTPSVPFVLDAALPSDPNSSAYAAAHAYSVFSSGFSQGYTLAQIRTALNGISFATPNFYSPPTNFVAPKTTEWSFELERTLNQHNVLAVTYSGNHGYDQAISNTWANSFLLLASNGVNKYFPSGFCTAGQCLPTAAPDPRFLTVTQVLTAGRSNYDGLSVQLRHAMSYGFQGQIQFTWSHALGVSSVPNPYNLNFGYGNESIDRRRALSADLVWIEPHRFSDKFVRGALGGWNFGLKMYVYSGIPFSASDSKLAAEINSGGGTGTILGSVLDPSIIGMTCTAVHGTSDTPCFTTGQFYSYSTSFGSNQVQPGFGVTGPNIFRGPGYFDIDTQLSKKFFVKEKYAFEFGAQAFNTLNHPSFAVPTASLTSGSLGTTSSTVGPPSSIYGSGQGSIVNGRVLLVTGKFSF